MSDLPAGWAWATVGDVAATSLGQMLDKKQATGLHPTPYLRNINVRWASFDLSDVATMDIAPEHLDRVLARYGDLIVCEGGEPGRAAVWRGPEPIALQKALHRVRPSQGVSPDYLAYWLWSEAGSGRLAKLFTGSTIKHLPQEKLRLVRVPLPPSKEQERIVTAIEEQLSRLDAANAALRSGARRLIPLPARLIDRSLAGWPTKPLGELIREPLRNGHSAKRAVGGDVPVFTLTAVTARDFTDRNMKLTAADLRRVEDLWVERGDIFVERSNTPELVGTAALYDGSPRRAIFPDLLIRVRVGPSLLPEFAELALRSTRIRRYFQQRAKGIAGSMPKIDQQTILEAELPVPPIDVQAHLVDEVDRELTLTSELSSAISRALTRSERLRRVILGRAFSGHLLPQDPSHEPASELLARITAERVKAPKPRRRQRA